MEYEYSNIATTTTAQHTHEDTNSKLKIFILQKCIGPHVLCFVPNSKQISKLLLRKEKKNSLIEEKVGDPPQVSHFKCMVAQK